MKQILKKASAMLVVPALAVATLVATPATVLAQADCNEAGSVTGGISGGADCAQPTNAPSRLFGPDSIFVTVMNILLFIIGAIAVVMLIIGGIRYVVSSGDQNAVTSAKNTILYAIIGLIVAFLAFAAVNFLSDQLVGGTTDTEGAVPTLINPLQ